MWGLSSSTLWFLFFLPFFFFFSFFKGVIFFYICIKSNPSNLFLCIFGHLMYRSFFYLLCVVFPCIWYMDAMPFFLLMLTLIRSRYSLFNLCGKMYVMKKKNIYMTFIYAIHRFKGLVIVYVNIEILKNYAKTSFLG